MSYIAARPFHAARQVDVLPAGHPCRRLHGHNFLARVGVVLPAGWAAFPGGEVEALEARLATVVEELDYRGLNDLLDQPTDENLCRRVGTGLDTAGVPGPRRVGIQSTADQGVDLDEDGHLHVWRRFRFEAAHYLPGVPEGHQCGRMHGHGFEIVIHCDQTLAADEDLGIDYDLIAAHWAPLHAELDHTCLNDLPGLENPTSEMICRWLWTRLAGVLPALSWVTCYETVTAGCHHDGRSFRIWKEQRFEGATRLAAAPEGHVARRLHGHSYLLRLHLTAPLDEVLGWTVDYGDVKAAFKPAYARLDHHRLDELPGIAGGDPASLLRWVRDEVGDALPALDRIDLHERPGCGASLAWGFEPPALPI